MEPPDNREIAFSKTYDLHAEAIVRYIYFKVSDYQLAEDLSAETFLKFWRRLSAPENIRNEKALLFTIARGLIIDYYRKSDSKPVQISEVEENFLVAEDNVQKSVELKEQTVQLFSHMGQLRDEYRDALHMYYIEELTVPEIAEILEKHENAIRVLIHRALKALKEIYERSGLNR